MCSHLSLYMFNGCNIACLPQEIKDSLAEELDFINEGHNSERCYKDLQHFPYIHVPKVHWDKTTKVLLMVMRDVAY